MAHASRLRFASPRQGFAVQLECHHWLLPVSQTGGRSSPEPEPANPDSHPKNEPRAVERERPTPVQIPDRPPFVVVSRPVPPGMVVRTADRKREIKYISNEELLKAVPGIAIARVGDPRDDRKIIIGGPGKSRILHLN